MANINTGVGVGTKAVQAAVGLSRSSVPMIGLGLLTSIPGYQARIKEGQNPIYAAAVESINMAAYSFMGFLPAMAAVEGPKLAIAAGKALYNYNRVHQSYRRQMKTPFSHRFEHTDVTANAQQAGLSALSSASQFAGTEAASMASRYARR